MKVNYLTLLGGISMVGAEVKISLLVQIQFLSMGKRKGDTRAYETMFT